MWYYNEWHPLLLDCLVTFLRCIIQIREAFGSLYQPLMGHIVPFSTKVDSQIACKIQDLGTLFGKANGILYCKDAHTLLLNCLLTFYICVHEVYAELQTSYLSK